MSKRSLLPVTLALFILASELHAQYIPDVNFRAWLELNYPGSVDVNGILDASALPTEPYTTSLHIDWSPVDLTGLDAFAMCNLLILDFAVEGDVVFPAFPPALEQLDILHYPGTDLPPFPTGLILLELDTARQLLAVPDLPPNLTNVVLTGLGPNTAWPHMEPGLEDLRIADCLQSTPPVIAPGTEILRVHAMPFMSEGPTIPPGVLSGEFWDVPMVTSFDISTAVDLSYLEITGCVSMVSLTGRPVSLETLILAQAFSLDTVQLAPNLRHLELQDASLCLPPLPDSLEELSWNGCIPNYTTHIHEPYMLCSFINSPCGDKGARLSGHVFYDLDGDAIQDPDEPNAPFIPIHAGPEHTNITNLQGDYHIIVGAGSYLVSVEALTAYSSESLPLLYDVQALSEDTTLQHLDFALQTGTGTRDAGVYISAPPGVRGTDRTIFLQYRQVAIAEGPFDATITLQLDENEIYVGSTYPPTTVDGDLLTWHLSSLPRMTEGFITVVCHIPALLPLGTVLTDTTTMIAANDDVPANNVSTVTRDVIGSLDPNDKEVSPSTLSPDEIQAGTPVDYTIRFQNTGTFYAERVVITDTLSGDLQAQTIHVEQTSHPCEWFYREGVLYFIFENIFLPDSTTDEPGSHGFVRFSILPNTNLIAGNNVTNVANIYFDFNEPVITEPCVLTIDQSTGVPSQGTATLQLFPDPVSDMLSVRAPELSSGRYEVLAGDGRRMAQGRITSGSAQVDVRSFPAGMYVLHATDASGHTLKSRFIKH